MGFFSRLVGEGAAQPIEAIGRIIDAVHTSEDEKLSKQEILERLAQNPSKWQTEITKIEAQHRSPFVAGWRPFIGWVGGVSLACYFIPQYIMGSVLWVRLSWVAIEAGEKVLPAYPVSAEGLLELVGGILGLAILRSSDKVVGKAK